MMQFWVLALVCLTVAAPLPYIGTQPTEGVWPELRVQVLQEWFLPNVSSSCVAVNYSITWMEPESVTWLQGGVGNFSFYYGMRNLWLPAYEYRNRSTGVAYTVNVTVDITKRDARFNTVHWDVSAVDEQIGILFAREGSLSAANATTHITELLVFRTPAYPISGGTGDWTDWLQFFWPWWVVGLILFIVYEVWRYWPTHPRAASSP